MQWLRQITARCHRQACRKLGGSLSASIGNIRAPGSARIRVAGRSAGIALALAGLLLGSMVAAGASDRLFSDLSALRAPNAGSAQSHDLLSRALIPVTAADELFVVREFERAEERFLALVGVDHRSRLLRQKARFGLETADASPLGGGIHADGIFNLALNPDRRLSKRAVQPRLIQGNHLPEFLAPANPALARQDHRLAIASEARAAGLDARSNFTIEFICHLRRATSTASEASDASSSPVQGRIA